jgi:hypothetical protein
VITDLERVADLATNLGDYTLAADQDLYPDVDVQGIGDAVLEMVDDAMAAYADEDLRPASPSTSATTRSIGSSRAPPALSSRTSSRPAPPARGSKT